MTEEMKAMIELVNKSLKEVEPMSKADKMFEDLGYEKIDEYTFEKVYDIEKSKFISFFHLTKSWFINCELEDDNSIDELNCVCEKIKELGWLDE